MLIPDEIRKCVAFILYKTAEGYKLAGTVFFAGIMVEGFEGGILFAITAKHVIEGIRKRSLDGTVYIRLNFTNGPAKLIMSDIAVWRFHPTDPSVDVAVMPITLTNDIDALFYPTSSFATEKVIANEKIGIGEEVFLVGMFYPHTGKKRNIPIVRIGNIAAMPEEPVYTEDLGEVEAYLVEARSIGGLSGSPVFVHLPAVRPDEHGTFRYANSPIGIFYLLGLMHGHWDRPVSEEEDVMLADDLRQESVNMGIAVVVPAKKILETIYQPTFEPLIRKGIEEVKSKAPKPDKS